MARVTSISLVLTLLWTRHSLACPAVCSCVTSPTGVTATCDGVSAMPTGFPAQVTSLTVTNCSMSALQLPALPLLTHLDLSRCALAALTRQSLAPVRSTLTSLAVRHNTVSLTLPEDAFTDLPNLDTLDLTASHMHSATALASAAALRTLVIDNNPQAAASLSLTQLPSTLQSLHMRHMNLTFLPYDFFAHLNVLRTLDLSHNFLETILLSQFDSNDKLVTLDIQHNRLKHLPYVPASLQTLRLGSNSILKLEENAIARLKSIKVLDVSNNNLQVYPADVEPVFSGATELHLAGNPLHCNCEMRWFRQWIETTSHSHGAEYCRTPARVRVTDLPPANFTCVAPRITAITASRWVAADTVVTLVCRAWGEPAPDIQWTHPDGHRFTVSHTGNRTDQYTEGVFTVPVERTGVYTCTARNQAGNHTRHVTLSVGEAPTTTARTTTVPETTTTLPETTTTVPETTTTVPETTTTVPETTTTVTETTTVPETTTTVPETTTTIPETTTVPETTTTVPETTTIPKTTVITTTPTTTTKPTTTPTTPVPTTSSPGRTPSTAAVQLLTASEAPRTDAVTSQQTTASDGGRTQAVVLRQDVAAYVAVGVVAALLVAVLVGGVVLHRLHVRKIRRKYKVSKDKVIGGHDSISNGSKMAYDNDGFRIESVHGDSLGTTDTAI